MDGMGEMAWGVRMRVTKDDCQIWASTSSAELEVAADEYEAKGAEIPEIADIARRIRVELDRREALAPPRPYAPPFAVPALCDHQGAPELWCSQCCPCDDCGADRAISLQEQGEPMLIALLDQVAAWAKTAKTRSLEEGKMLHATLAVYRDGIRIAEVGQSSGNGAAVADMVVKAGRGYRADTLALVTDTYHTVYALDDTPAKRDDPDNLEARFERGDPAVTEALAVMAGDPSEGLLVLLPYTTSGWVLRWDDAITVSNAMADLPDAMHFAVDRSGSEAVLEVIARIADRERLVPLDDVSLLADVGATLALLQAGCTVDYVGPDADYVHTAVSRIIHPSTKR